jgi:hypothetical protein
MREHALQNLAHLGIFEADVGEHGHLCEQGRLPVRVRGAARGNGIDVLR